MTDLKKPFSASPFVWQDPLVIPPRCETCHGSGRVCEWHPYQSWPDECDCGAGAHCATCSGTGSQTKEG